MPNVLTFKQVVAKLIWQFNQDLGNQIVGRSHLTPRKTHR